MGRLRSSIREFFIEMKARRAGRRAMGPNDEFFQTVRGVVGITGGTLSKGPWEHIANDNDRYSRSMKKDPVLPPSLFVSDRDRIRHGLPTPVVERCLEDVGNPDAMKVGDWDIAEIDPDS